VDVELARQHWDEGRRRVEAARPDAARYARLNEQVDLVTSALRRRVGQSFTLDDLVREYAAADDWAAALLHDAVAEDAPPPETATAADAAFHRYALGATDYVP
jgi:hypothetical protein